MKSSMGHIRDLASLPAAMVDQPADGGYPGGKGLDGLYHWILSYMPTHALYVEPFAGKGGIVRRKPPALTTLLFDLDRSVVRWWKRLRWPGCTAAVCDGIPWMEKHASRLSADSLIYADPPYLQSTRVKKRIYRFEMTDRQHRRFLRASRKASCPVMISGYVSPLYDDTLSDWHRFTRLTITRGRSLRTECLWCNFDPERMAPALALRYEALGSTFRERERVGRMVKTWTSRIAAMPAAQRRAVALAVLDAYAAAIAADADGDVGQLRGAGADRTSRPAARRSSSQPAAMLQLDLFGGSP